MFSKLRFFRLDNKLLYQRALYRTVTKYFLTSDSGLYPVPRNVDVTERTRFSPRRNREQSTTVIISQNFETKSKCYIPAYFGGTSSAVKDDPHIQSYYCFGTVNLNSAMQSNVPNPFGGMHTFSHLNMPRGQSSQQSKFTSANLQKTHYILLRKDASSQWSHFANSVNNRMTDSADKFNDTCMRSYCTHPKTTQKVLSKKEQLKQGIRDYGTTIFIFHIAISLVSLGSFYVLISNGINVVEQLEQLGCAPDVLKSSIAVGASNFVISYAIHKIFAPVRISITLGTAPFIVRYMRSKGILKPKKPI